MNILNDEFPADIYRSVHEQTNTFRQHLDQLSSKKTHAYADWWNDRFLGAIHDDANQFVASDTQQLATALTEPDADMPDTIAMRARVNRTILETG